ncbi:MAG: filamin/ABP280 repeat domain-containing protein [Gemmatimonadales bacterium]
MRWTVPVTACFAVAACGGGNLVLPNEGQPAGVAMFSGDRQTAAILAPAEDSLVVVVTDRFGSPVEGVEIAWAAAGGGDLSPATSITGASGRAATQRVLGAQPGTYGTTALATVLPENVVSFTTTAVAARLVLATEPGATASSGAVLSPQPVLQLQDPSGNPLARAGVQVTVQVASGDGSLRGTTTQGSDETGTIGFRDLAIVGTPGPRTLIFAAPGYAPATSAPVSLGIGGPAAVAVATGDGQAAPVGTAVPTPPGVLVRDAGGTPLAGIGVRFAAASGGGTVTGENATTGADGVAAVGSWTLGGSVGANTLTATVQSDGVSGNPVTFSATATPGPASAERSAVSAAPGSIAASSGSAASAVTVIVRDSRGNPLAGQSVTLSASGSGVTLTQPGPTDGSGTTSGRLSATAAGSHDISAASGGVTIGAATVTVTAGAGVPGRTVVGVPSGTAGVETSVQIRLNDQFDNPVSGGSGQLAVSVSGPNSSNKVQVEDQGGGTYRARYTPTLVGTDQIDVRVAGQPAPGAPFASAVVAGPADASRTTADVPDGAFGVPLQIFVFVTDGQGNRLGQGGDAVQVAVESAGELSVVYVGDGTYRADWTPLALGTVAVDIRLNGTPIAKSPFSSHIRFFR